MPQPNIVAFIFARGGSKGLPGKNLRPLNGVPLIGHAIRCAKQVPGISRVIVSTDDDDIALVARSEGAEVPFLRPAHLASDTASELGAWRHAVDFVESQPGVAPIDIFVSVPAVCPLRQPGDVARAIDKYRGAKVDIVFTVTPARANPYYTLVELGADGAAHLCKSPPDVLHGRQAAPQVFEIVALAYVTSPAFIRRAERIWDGSNAVIEVPRERAVDIDTETDFMLAEILAARRGRI